MWKKEIIIETEATKEQIWKVWSDVQNWNKWDNEVKSSEIKGKFEQGTIGILKPKNGPKSKFKLEYVNYPIEFISRSSLPLAKMDVTHKLTEINGKLFLTHGVEIRGVTSFLFSKIIGKKIIEELPKALRNLSKMAEKL